MIAQSFERIHRSNLVGMGILPLTFEPGTVGHRSSLLAGDRDDRRAGDSLTPRKMLRAKIVYPDGATKDVPLLARIDTLDELEYFRNGGILPYVLRQLLGRADQRRLILPGVTSKISARPASEANSIGSAPVIHTWPPSLSSSLNSASRRRASKCAATSSQKQQRRDGAHGDH